MPPEITTKVVANNTLQTQCVKIGQITNYFRGYQEENKYPRSNLEMITFDYFDPTKLDFIPGRYHNFGYYNFEDTDDFNGNQNPVNQKSFDWSHYGTYTSSCNIGQIKLGEGYDNLLNGLFIQDGTISQPNYFYHDLSETDLDNIRQTKNGYIDFEIALCPDAYNRPANFEFTEPTSVNKDYFVNSTNDSVVNYFAIGAYSSNESERFRFILSFILMKNEAQDDYIVYFRPNITDGKPGDDAVLVPNWNGISFKKFKFEYNHSINNVINGTLYYYNKDDTVSEIVSNITPSNQSATYPYSIQFGSYSSGGEGNMIVKYLNYNAYVTSDYHIILNDFDPIAYTFDTILDRFKERYKFKVSTDESSDNTIIVDWNWMNKQSRIQSNSGQLDNITLENSFFDSSNINSLTYLQNPRKTVKIYSNSNKPVKELILDNELVYNINTTGAPSLKRLIVNQHGRLDLSENKKLNVIYLLGGSDLSLVKLPMISHNMIIRARDSFSKILDIESTVPVKNPIKPKVFLDVNLNSKIETLILKNISLITDLEEFTSEETNELHLNEISQYIIRRKFTLFDREWTNLKLVDISYSNIISNHEMLETFLNHLPDRTGKENGLIFMYGPKFTINGIQGNMSDIDTVLENLRNKNWLFYA